MNLSDIARLRELMALRRSALRVLMAEKTSAAHRNARLASEAFSDALADSAEPLLDAAEAWLTILDARERTPK